MPTLFRVSLIAVLVLAIAAIAWWMTSHNPSQTLVPARVTSEPRPVPAAAAPVVAPSTAATAPVAPAAQDAASAPVAPRVATPVEAKPAPAKPAPAKTNEPASSPAAPVSPTTVALVAAHRTGKQSEQTSPLLAPPPFNPETFAKDPAPYLTQSVPGRVFQTAAPGPGVPVLGAKGHATHEISPGASCDLVVKAPAGAPVTYTTFDLGTFANGLASITVTAGQDGLATATFMANGNVAGDVHLLAGSPMASGQVKFLVGVTVPPLPVQ